MGNKIGTGKPTVLKGWLSRFLSVIESEKTAIDQLLMVQLYLSAFFGYLLDRINGVHGDVLQYILV